jgi:filamentous hemagglutinin
MEARGKHRARVFKSALGFDQSNWEVLRQAILDTLPYHEGVLRKQTEYGNEYTVMMPITGPNGETQEVLTGWIIEPGAEAPRLTIARVLTEKEVGYARYKKSS